jgi:hypothetical protein
MKDALGFVAWCILILVAVALITALPLIDVHNVASTLAALKF